ncbi:MAG: hypothetical protein R2752_03040 [Vicinamibacterales bacterium]
MGRYGMLLTVGVLASVASPVAQVHPDLGGRWTLLHQDDVRGEPMAAFGESFVATQTSTSLTIDGHSVGPAGRGAGGKLVYRPMHSTFPFDGSESNVSRIISTGSTKRIIDTAAWDGATLVITTTWRGGVAPYVSRKLNLSLHPDGTLVVALSTPPEQPGAPWSIVESRYRRVDRSPSRE